MTKQPRWWSCSRWGHTSRPMTQNPGCNCCMCDRHRQTMEAVKKKKGKKGKK